MKSSFFTSEKFIQRQVMLNSSGVRAFSLVEVVFALAVFVFAVLSIVGLMATGLVSASTSSNNFALANITRSLRATYQGTNYYADTHGYGILTTTGGVIVQGTNYFTSAGYATNSSDPTYYTVTCTPLPTSSTTSLVNSVNAAVVTVNVTYPPIIPAPHTNSFTMFLAH